MQIKICICLCLYCYWRSNYQEWWVGIPLTCLTPPHLCARHKPGPVFPPAYVVYFVFNDSKGELAA